MALYQVQLRFLADRKYFTFITRGAKCYVITKHFISFICLLHHR